MNMYVVYQNPSDYPGRFVVRKWTVTAAGPVAGNEPIFVGETLQGARDAIPRGLIATRRCEEDDPVILEVWF